MATQFRERTISFYEVVHDSQGQHEQLDELPWQDFLDDLDHMELEDRTHDFDRSVIGGPVLQASRRHGTAARIGDTCVARLSGLAGRAVPRQRWRGDGRSIAQCDNSGGGSGGIRAGVSSRHHLTCHRTDTLGGSGDRRRSEARRCDSRHLHHRVSRCARRRHIDPQDPCLSTDLGGRCRADPMRPTRLATVAGREGKPYTYLYG